MSRRLLSVAGGLAVDRVLGEPQRIPHPVALFGKGMGRVEQRCYAPAMRNGTAYTAIGVALGGLCGVLVGSPLIATSVTVAGKSLADTAQGVLDALESGDLESARSLLPGLVGRDPSELDEAEVSRAVVESVAENTVDAVIAPAMWAVFGGAPGAFGYRAVNTMDAMVGHRSERYRRFGTPAARLDDAANWVPARLTALLVAVARPRQAREVWQTVRSDAPGHPSPNAGIAEAAFAAALGIRLGGESRYGERTETRPQLGTGRAVEPSDIREAVRLSRDCTAVLGVALVACSLAFSTRLRTRT